MLRFGLLGAGRIGQIHGRNAAASPKGELVAIADPFPKAAESLAKATGAQVRDIDAIFSAKDIDAVLICTPTTTHADFIERAAKAGKAIFCEKPVDLDAKRAESRREKWRTSYGWLQPPLRRKLWCTEGTH
jgi:myo-inositol 2-dehydrogenase / D-chiro-inositol 1-dehydrogenase